MVHELIAVCLLTLTIKSTLRNIIIEQNQISKSHFSRLNICITDGTTSIVTRYASKGQDQLSLHHATKCFDLNFRDDGSAESEAKKSTIIASEPLTDVTKEWVTVPESHYVILRTGRPAEMKSFQPFHSIRK